MKESRFIELLNLYIDQQISSEEAAELEGEISQSPAHYRTYLQYCRMHRACVVLFENFQTPAAPLAPDLHRADGKVSTFPARGFRFTRAAGSAGLAVAAACIAFVLINHSDLHTVVQVNVPPESFHTVAVDVPARPSQFRTAFTARKFSPADNRFPAGAQQAAFDWMNQIDLSPMSAYSERPVVFTVPVESAPSGQRFAHVSTAEQPAVEMTSFEFNK